MEKVYNVEARDFSAAGEAAADIKKNLRRLGMDSSIIRRTSIISYECEMNMVIHALNGKLKLNIDGNQIKITAVDEGPGINDVKKAMKPGFTTASQEIREMGFGAGMGLVNIKKFSDELNINSEVGKGTRVESVVFLQ